MDSSRCQSILEEIEGTHLDGKEELISCFRAVKRNLGPLKGRTKIELITLNERLQRKLDDQIVENTPKLSPDVVQRIGHLPIAGPSHSGRVFLNGTPLRKAPSMGVYASPESLPRQHFPRPAFFRLSPAPSPTFRATSPMDVDDELLLTPTTSGQLDAPMEKPRLEPSELENESQARLVAEKIDLYESNKKLSALLSAAKAGAQESEQDKNKLMDELADCQVYAQSYKDQICLLEAQQDELLGRKDARNQELEEDIDSLRMLHGQATEEISEVKQQIRQLESRLAESESRRNDLEKEKTGFIQRIQHLEAVLQDISLRFVRDSQSLAERVQREIGKG
ncbi:hypothetical protein C8R44DRAFT_734534 [Mycena epipterygia]|nr:hypothetical protein C8R44DRAFT_734534 [Mycena epipterygia]